MKRYKTVDDYIDNAPQWQAELKRLREIMNATPLVEEVKWGAPAYTHNGKILVGVGGFKQWFCLWFHQGALLEDSDGVLVNAQEGKTKALRQWRMTSKNDIKPSIVKRYVKEAITPGKQREYAEHVASAKRDDTKQKRIDKILPMITAGVGLHDKYRNC